MNYRVMEGRDISSDIRMIKEQLKTDNSVVFVYDGEGTLYDYIRFLNDGNRGLKNDELYFFKICYERKNLNINYLVTREDGTLYRRQIQTMSGLINELDGTTKCRIVVNSNDRAELAFIVQQLIFLQYPLQTVDIMLQHEVRDANKIKRFMERVDALFEKCGDALTRLTALRDETEQQEGDPVLKADKLGDIDSAIDSCRKIQADLEKAVAVKLKLAVAASKKTGKSVIVNCFIGEEIAPTDAELATPNNCIYQRSTDGQYHLKMDGQESIADFSTCAEIHDAIDRQFRDAQNNASNGFSLPDMEISYVSKGNNFSSYTIYDTAGPDAAGTTHKEAAERAINECDVAIFAIDYAKYLTESEEKYLEKVKSVFEGQQKFHSLVFALNKTDIRYNDSKTMKSIISSVDFVRTRLRNLSPKYADCIIFPTSSLEYFNVLEAQAAHITELDSPVTDMKTLKMAHRDVPALQWLHTHSENLEYFHGITSFSADVFMQDSGMPALMSYVSYVTTSKARSEIVNNVAHEIDLQNKKLQTILNTVTNLETLIQADEGKIQRIKDIVERYKLAVQVILQKAITDDEWKALPSPNYMWDNYHGKLEHMRTSMRDMVEQKSHAPAILSWISEKTRQLMWRNLAQHREPMTESECSAVLRNLVSSSDITALIYELFDEKKTEILADINTQFQRVRAELKKIGENRQLNLADESKRVKQELEKEEVDLVLPELSNFEFDVPLQPIYINITKELTLYIPPLSPEEVFKKEGGIGAVLKRIFTFGILTKYELNIDKSDFQRLYKKSIEAYINSAVSKQDIPRNIEDALIESFIEEYATTVMEGFDAAFKNTMDAHLETIAQFCKAIDDRDKYAEENGRRTKRKENIAAIQLSIAELMSIWNTVIEEVKEAGHGTD